MWSDRETDQDCLGYSSYVEVLADICLHKDLAPLTLGIFGSWGSGKTSLMQMLRRCIDQVADQAHAKTLWYNAWRYEGREEAQSALIHAILAKIGEDKTLLDSMKGVFDRLKKGASVLKIAKFIGKTAITLTPDIDALVDCFQAESDKVAETIEQFDSDFGELLRQAKVDRVVVFVDDLDRCTSEKVIETFETIKLFLNTPSCTFVIGADAAKIEHAVGEVCGIPDPKRQKDYIEKIIQIPFAIPEQGLRDIACYVGMLIIGQRLDSKGWETLIKSKPEFYAAGRDTEKVFCAWSSNNRVFFANGIEDTVRDLQAVLPYVDILGRGLRGNPRQIKRFLNILSLRKRLAVKNSLEVGPDLLIKMAVLEYAWSDFFNALVETVNPTSGRSDLIDEMLRASKSADSGRAASKLVADSLAIPGLIDFLSAKPELGGKIDLNPYLFLAQTSLSRGRTAALLPAEEQVRMLVSAIESDDQIRSKAAAARAAALEPGLAATVCRQLVDHLSIAKEAVVRTHILVALEIICGRHVEQFPVVVEAMKVLDPSGNDAVALAASTLLSAAQRAGTAIPDGLQTKLTQGSPLATALALRKKPSAKLH